MLKIHRTTYCWVEYTEKATARLLFDFGSLLLPKPVKGTVSITLGTDETRKGKSGELPIVDPVLIHMPYVDLNGCVVLRSDQPISRRAFPWHVEIHDLTLFVLHFVR